MKRAKHETLFGICQVGRVPAEGREARGESSSLSKSNDTDRELRLPALIRDGGRSELAEPGRLLPRGCSRVEDFRIQVQETG